MGWIMALALLIAAQAGPIEDGPVVTATQVQDWILGGQPFVCPPPSDPPAVRQPTLEELAEAARAEAYFEAWRAERADSEPDWRADSQGWLAYQCRDAGEGDPLAACQTNARARLVHLRAAQIDARPVADPLARPTHSGGVSVSTSLLDDDGERSSPRSRGSCDVPASGESNAAFVIRCPPGGGPRRE